MSTLRFYLPGIFVWGVALSFFLSIFIEVFGAGWGPPFYIAYYVCLGLFILTIRITPPGPFRRGTATRAQPERGEQSGAAKGGATKGK